MPEPSLAMTMDDDLPRTVRRERDARERAARESRERERDVPPMAAHAPSAPMPMHAVRDDYDDLPAPAATVTNFDVPFTKLMLFLIKVVLAGIPAIILLTAILWGFGAVMKSVFPWLVHTQITISVPR